MRCVYLDHFASTPVDDRVLCAMLPYFRQEFGNPANQGNHYGRRASEVVDRARRTIAEQVGCDEAGIIFTSGATESNNLALRGVAERLGGERRHLVVSAIEHKSVLEPARWLGERGFSVTFLPVDANGLVHPGQIRSAVTPSTLLVSVMAVNNEVGTIQPLAEIGAIAKSSGALFHCDATQGLGKVPLDMRQQGIHLLSISGHKLYGPKGVGALCVAGFAESSSLLAPQSLGGGQEHGLRSGTLNVPGIVGLAEAAALMVSLAAQEQERLGSLRDALHQGLKTHIDGVQLNASLSHSIAGALNVSIEGVRSSALLARVPDIALSGAAACGGQSARSHVLAAMGLTRARIQSALRFGVGRFNTVAEVEHVVQRIAAEVQWIRAQPRFDLQEVS